MSSAESAFKDAVNSLKVGRFADAERLFKKVLARQPTHLGALNLMTVALMSMERFSDAERFIRAALNINSNSDVSFYNYGIILKKLGKPNEALQQFDRAIRLNPKVCATWNNRGTVFNDLNQYQNALSDFDQAISLDSKYHDAFYNRGKSLSELKRHDEALAAFDNALALKPNLAEAWLGRGNVLFELKRHDEASAAYGNALELKPDLAAAWLGRGNVFRELNHHDEAFAAYDRALSLKPDLTGAEGARLQAKMHICDWRDLDAECTHLISSVRNGSVNALPFPFLAVSSSAGDQLKCAKLWIAKKSSPTDTPLWQGRRYAHDRIRVAYLSADFRQHVVSQLMIGLFECHDKSRFETTAMSWGPDDNSEMRRRLEASFERFIDVGAQSDDQVAVLAQALEIDVLVDLKGFTNYSRAGIFARRAAPIQVNYLGYPGTMGAEYMDYIIADRIVIPEDQHEFYSEKIAVLPSSYYPNSYRINDAKRSTADKAFTRAELGLPSAGFVFCCLNNNYKLTPHIFDCWMRILKQVDGSVLWLTEDNATAAANLRKEAVARGVNAERLVFAKRMTPLDHLARQRLADLFLDTLPYNAHTTATDALWAGVPVLTNLGSTFAGRVAASLLNAIHLPELVTTTLEAYERTAIDLAVHSEKLLAIKRKLDQHRLTTPLFDTPTFTKHIEAAYTAMVERHQAGLAPDHLRIPSS